MKCMRSTRSAVEAVGDGIDSSWLEIERSVPFGRYCRSSPLVFSQVPRCHGLCGSQKYTRTPVAARSEEHTSELQSHLNLVCRLLLEKKKTTIVVTAAILR